MALVRGTTISLQGKGILLRGSSGAGKSDLALRLIEGGASLVADDNTDITVESGKARASPPPQTKGFMEVRGLGILEFPFKKDIPLALVVDLVEHANVPRLPETETVGIEGVEIRRLSLHAFDASTPAKIRLALKHL